MKIECIANTGATLPGGLIRPELGLTRDRAFALIESKSYVVHGLTFYLGEVWYYICDEDNTGYPVWNPSPLFRIIDPRLSAHWVFGFHTLNSNGQRVPIITFKEWVEQSFFYDRLTDGQPIEVAIFTRYRRLLDEEFN